MATERKKRITPEDSARGRAEAIAMARKQTPYSQMAAKLIKDFNCSERTAKNWIKAARKEVLTVDAQIDTGDLEASRWGRMSVWDARSRRYRQEADKALASVEERTTAPKFEYVAIKYEELVAKAAHFFVLPPERDLEEPEIRAMLINSLRRQYRHFGRDELIQLREDVQQALNERDSMPDKADEDGDQGDEII